MRSTRNPILEIPFWCLLALVGYTYVGYGLLITLLARVIPRAIKSGNELPTITLLIAAYNEQEIIADKIRNSLKLDYPRDRLELVVVADGSDDRTAEIAGDFAADGVRCLHIRPRHGKMAALRRALALTEGEVVVFSDANTWLEPGALRYLVAPFADPSVGCVAGEKRVQSAAGEGSGEGLYWRYESYLKSMDSRVHSVTGAAGELFAARRAVLELPPDSALLDDFMISMLVARQGYRVVYEPSARAIETASPSLADDFERRARIGCGGFQSMWWLRGLLNPRHGLLWFQYVSHRVLRWAVAPLALPLLVVLNILLLSRWRYRVLLALQLTFYALAAIGLSAATRGKRPKLLLTPGYFVLMNGATLMGLFRYVTRTQPAAWRKATRIRN
jgi:cellulose synthase/poly-beta-1,6-N-acetylglucosamine synthase-like glycosyltransferase